MLNIKKMYGWDENFHYNGLAFAQEDPMNNGHYLLPQNATFIEVLPERGNDIRVWNKNKWEYLEDKRDIPYWIFGDKFDSAPKYMKELGPLPEYALLEQPEKTEKDYINNFNNLRSSKLADTDYLILSDYPLDENVKKDLLEYRQKLRDMPLLNGYPWPDGDFPWPMLSNNN